MTEVLKYASATEKRIVKRLISLILAESDNTISVNDGGEWVVEFSRDRGLILAALGSTSDDTIRVNRGVDDVTIGRFWLVWGNEDDLISDHSDNDYCGDIAHRI